MLVSGAGAVHAEVPIGLQAGYAFRPVEGAVGVDDRFHGASAALTVDAPPVLFGFSGRLETLVLAWPGGETAREPLLAAVAVPSLIYRFDDSGPQATAAMGPAVGMIVEGRDVVVTFGVEASLLIRLPIVDGVNVDARVGVGQLGGVGLHGTALIGLSFEPDRLLARAMAGEGPETIAREVAPTFLPDRSDHSSDGAHDDDTAWKRTP